MATLGAELITNPGFYIVITPWVIEGTEWYFSAPDQIQYDDFGFDDTIYQTISITSGKTYRVRINIDTASGANGTVLNIKVGGTLFGTISDGDTGWHNITGTAGSNGKIEIDAVGVNSFADYFIVNSCSVKELISADPKFTASGMTASGMTIAG